MSSERHGTGHPLLSFGQDGDGGLQIREILRALRRRWHLIAAAVALATTAFVIRYSVTPKEYIASTRIQIERRSLAGLAGSQGPTNAWLENFWNLEYYPTQYELLKSRGLAERVVKHLDLMNSPDFNPGRFARPQAAGEAPTAADDDRVLGILANRLRGGLRIAPLQKTQLVDISYRSTDRDMVAEVANAYAQEYILLGIENRSSTATAASSLLQEQLDTLRQRISEKEEEIDRLSRSSNIVTLDSSSTMSDQNLNKLNDELVRAEAEAVEQEARHRALSARSRRDIAKSVADGEVSALEGKLQELERQHSTLAETYKPEWPRLKDLKSDIEQTRRDLDAKIQEVAARVLQSSRSEMIAAQGKVQALRNSVADRREQRLRERSSTSTLQSLQAEVESMRLESSQLLARLSEADFTSRLQTAPQSNVKVVDRALRPGGPFRPILRDEVSLGLILGLIAGIGLVLLLEFLDRTLKDQQEAERLLGLPTLAVIPDIGGSGGKLRRYGYGYGYGYGARGKGRWRERKQGAEPVSIELLPHHHPRLVASEAYRALRTALLLSSAEKLQVVAMTSAESGEGKTTTASNLAVVMAQLGQRVLLVDADLRKPRVHKVFKVSNQFGLVNLLTGNGSSEQVYQKTEVPNLYLLPSGPMPPNPAELLASSRMQELVEQFRQSFDMVVIDTTPALAVTDATLVGSLADGVLLCLRAGQVLREEAKACRDALLMSDVRILGTVLNRYRTQASGYERRYRQYEAYAEPASETAADPAA